MFGFPDDGEIRKVKIRTVYVKLHILCGFFDEDALDYLAAITPGRPNGRNGICRGCNVALDRKDVVQAQANYYQDEMYRVTQHFRGWVDIGNHLELCKQK